MREDPDRVFLVADDRPNLVSLKLPDCESFYSSIVEPTTRMGCLFEPSSDGIPGDLLYPCDSRLVRPSTLSLATSSNDTPPRSLVGATGSANP
jgi:hypothetical protein